MSIRISLNSDPHAHPDSNPASENARRSGHEAEGAPITLRPVRSIGPTPWHALASQQPPSHQVDLARSSFHAKPRLPGARSEGAVGRRSAACCLETTMMATAHRRRPRVESTPRSTSLRELYATLFQDSIPHTPNGHTHQRILHQRHAPT